MRIAFDSNVITYFLRANQDGYDPATDSDAALAVQRVAAFRLFLYCDNPIVLPTVAEEVESIPNAATRREHLVWTRYHLHEILPTWLNNERLSYRTAELAANHSGINNVNDCRIVAECEQSPAEAFATFDPRLINNLRNETKVFVATPDECWRRADVHRGAEPYVHLQPEHPLVNATWWRW